VGISVELEVEVMIEPPRADILLLRRETKQWTPAQLALLPDGIRDTDASHILLEFKYTQSITIDGLLQIASYQQFYLQSNDIKPSDLKCFILSAKQPQAKTLSKFDYVEVKAGIYHSSNCFIESIPLISLNTLPNTEYNAWMRCFASQKIQQKKAFELLTHIGLQQFSKHLYWIVNGLHELLFGKVKMDTDNLLLDPEEIMRVGKFWEESYKANMSVEERLEGLDAETVLSHYDAETRLKGLAPEERLNGLTPEQIEAYLDKIKR